MGRLPKRKIDEIQRLDREGYSKKEIGKMVGVSRGTAAKYIGKKPSMGENLVKEAVPQLLHEAIRTICNLLYLLNGMQYVEISDMSDSADKLALRFAERVAQISPEYAKHFMKDNRYIEWLRGGILDLSKTDAQLNETERKRRKAWVALMKKHYPEKLAEIV
ncbi:hypothetical protein KAU88_04060 [Candidatus Bathyarchaeota archaeon]|nr:hypothetical protein [Candidatus Bathyarchaeota archaeon]